MAFALVGSVGAVLEAAAPITPAWGTGESRTANNLLVCWCWNVGGGTITTPSGWLASPGNSNTFAIFYKVAAGGDAAPTLTNGVAAQMKGQLGEFSGNATASPLDQGPVPVTGTATPLVVTAVGADSAAAELVIYLSGAQYTTGATKTLTNTLNNGASATSSNNNAVSSAQHYDFGFGITTGHASADSDSFAFTTTKISTAGVVIASFKLAAAAPPIPLPSPVVSQAVNRSLTY